MHSSSTGGKDPFQRKLYISIKSWRMTKVAIELKKLYSLWYPRVLFIYGKLLTCLSHSIPTEQSEIEIESSINWSPWKHIISTQTGITGFKNNCFNKTVNCRDHDTKTQQPHIYWWKINWRPLCFKINTICLFYRQYTVFYRHSIQ